MNSYDEPIRPALPFSVHIFRNIKIIFARRTISYVQYIVIFCVCVCIKVKPLLKWLALFNVKDPCHIYIFKNKCQKWSKMYIFFIWIETLGDCVMTKAISNRDICFFREVLLWWEHKHFLPPPPPPPPIWLGLTH